MQLVKRSNQTLHRVAFAALTLGLTSLPALAQGETADIQAEVTSAISSLETMAKAILVAAIAIVIAFKVFGLGKKGINKAG